MGFFDFLKPKKKEPPKIEEEISFAPPGYEPSAKIEPMTPKELEPEPVVEVPRPVVQQQISEDERLVKLILNMVQERKDENEIQSKLVSMGYSEEQIRQGVEAAIKEMGVEDYIAAA